MRSSAKHAAVALAAATTFALVAAPAQAQGKNDVVKRGDCTGSTSWKLKVGPDDGRLEVEGEIDSNRNGQTWRWRIRHNGAIVRARRPPYPRPQRLVRGRPQDRRRRRPGHRRVPGPQPAQRRGVPRGHPALTSPDDSLTGGVRTGILASPSRREEAGVRLVKNPVAQFLAAGLVVLAVVVIGTVRLSREAADDEAIDDAR